VATVQDFAVDLFAEALPELGVLRDLEIENDALEEDRGDLALKRLVCVLDRLRLSSLDSHAAIVSLTPVQRLADSPAARRLTKLSLWFAEDAKGDEAVAVLAASPHLTDLRELILEDSAAFTDRALLAILDSPSLAGLTRCRLRPNEDMPLSEELVRRFAERFGPEIEQDATVVRSERT
jgi:hypothetical protein